MLTKQDIIALLITNDKAVGRALLAINARQTDSEQITAQTTNANGMGFTLADAYMGTSMAQFFAKTGRLTEKQLAYWRKPNVRGVPRICKYAGQLLEIAQQKAQAAKMMEPKVQPVEDVGNLMEERMVLEEQLSAYQEGAMGDGPEQTAAMNELSLRIDQINKSLFAAQEALAERQAFLDKMRRVAV